MKILKVEFENINSLAGKWCIDFTDSSYSELDHSLFVISGKTGMGKTSILDAITLALYGATPRQGLVYNGTDGNAVMTSDKGNCYARVTYKCQNGTFVSEWSQRRARDKADGCLQNAQGKIYPLDDPQNILFSGNTGAKGELGKANAAIIQLDYDEFCRSIMLAQGEFSKFLNCPERERAEILEKLNGTERYRLIGKKVGDHKSEAKSAKDTSQAAFDTLSSTMPSAEDIGKDEALLAEIADKEKALVEQKNNFDARINWRNSMNTCTANLKRAEDELATANKKKAEFAESEARLEGAEKARECATLHTELQGLRKRKATDETEFNKLQGELPDIKNKLTANAEKKTLAEKEKNAAEQFITENEALWNEIRKLDANLKNAESAKDEAVKRKANAARDLSNAETELSKAKKDIEKLEPQANALKQTQEQNAKDADLAGIIPQSETLIANIRGFDKEIAKEEKARNAAKHDMDIANETSKTASERRQQLLNQQNELFKNEVLVLADVIQKHLVEGEACPVCGSKDHPACNHSDCATPDDASAVNVAAKIRELHSQMQEADNKLHECELNLSRATTASNAANDNIDSLTRRKSEAAEQIADLWKPWAKFDIATADSTIADLKKRLQQFETNKTQLDNLVKQLELARNNVEVFGKKVKQERDRLETEVKALETAEKELQSLRNSRTEKFGEQDVETVASKATQRRNDAVTAFTAADEAFRDAENKSNELNTRINSLKDSLQATAGDIEAANTKFADAIHAKGFADEDAFQKASMPEEEFTQLQAKKKSTDDALATATGKRQQAADALEKVKAERSDETPLESLLEEKAKTEEALSTLQKNSGAARARVDAYKKNEVKLQALQNDLDAKKAEYTRWETMGDWFGVRDGSDFATFVQGLTFKSLLKLANNHLQIIKNRYRLVPQGNLGFQMHDAEFGTARRISNLSGGEKFLASLSLALGIADFASRNVRVESLFMDEGFGTLDDNTLEDVMNCLRCQQREGKMLGIITHVESVVNSINQKIMLDKAPGKSGHSTIMGPGVSHPA